MLRRVLVVAMMAQTASAFLAPSLALVGIASAGKVASMLRSSDVSRASGLRMSGGAPSTAVPKLVYFDARGVVEPIRLMLAAAGADYEDFRYKVDMSLKPPAAPEFAKAKESGDLAANMGRAPILEVDGAQIGQSHAIARYLARQHGMMGASDLEAAQIDTLYEHVRDIKDGWVKIRMGNMKEADEEVKKANVGKFLDEDLPQWCTKLEGALEAFGSTSGYAVGSKLSLADVVIYAWISCYFPAEHADKVKAAHAKCPIITAIVERAGSNEGIKKWEAERPVTFM